MFEELEQMLEQKHFSELKKVMSKMEPADIGDGISDDRGGAL